MARGVSNTVSNGNHRMGWSVYSSVALKGVLSGIGFLVLVHGQSRAPVSQHGKRCSGTVRTYSYGTQLCI